FSDRFVPGDISNTVHDLLVADVGEGLSLYACGSFTTAGGTTINRVARWDGLRWSPLANGLGSTVNALVAFDSGNGNGEELYAVGQFSAGGLARIARWDGHAWQPVGSGLNNTGHAAVVFDDDGEGPNPPALYVAGAFTTAGGVAVS